MCGGETCHPLDKASFLCKTVKRQNTIRYAYKHGWAPTTTPATFIFPTGVYIPGARYGGGERLTSQVLAPKMNGNQTKGHVCMPPTSNTSLAC